MYSGGRSNFGSYLIAKTSTGRMLLLCQTKNGDRIIEIASASKKLFTGPFGGIADKDFGKKFSFNRHLEEDKSYTYNKCK